MARPSIVENLGKMVTVQAGLAQGEPLSRACKAAGTTAGTYRKWLERYDALTLPVTVTPLSEKGVYHLSPEGRFLIVLDEDEAGIQLRRIDLLDSAEITHLLDRPQDIDYRCTVTAAASSGAAEVVFLLTSGALMSWRPEDGVVETLPLSLKDRRCPLGSMTMSGVRAWSPAAILPDLAHVAFWDSLHGESATLRVVSINDGAERMHHSVTGRSFFSAIVPHPSRPLLAILEASSLLTVLNHQTGELLVSSGPQVHSASFGPGDTVLSDDWYGCSFLFNYQDSTRTQQGRGWGSHASQSTRYITAARDVVHVKDLERADIDLVMNLDEIKQCGLSNDGRLLAVRTEGHVGVWDLGC
jgi:hypothetical protein